MVIFDGLKKLSEKFGRREAELFMCYVADCDITGLILNKSKELTYEQESLIENIIKRRKSGEPLQYIIGSTEFMSLEFKVTPDVLIPRSDTETLVEYLIEKTDDKKLSVLDIGTGSGCIIISLLKYCPNITAYALDISDGALTVAKENAKLNGVEVNFIKSDILKDVPDESFDIIVSNPPYIRPDVIDNLDIEVKDFEPYSALFGGEDGLLFYRRICEIAPGILNDNGILAFEIGYDQGKDVSELMKKDFSEVVVLKDLCGNDRVVTGKKKGAV